ncbi:15618_t:CDS:10 [Gigaspora margarita]|uniref:15618_t:CDS:1 n=1 Tax=Gigaspora margarita TaxID=4874 RepID=A0ABM8W2E3_GIGMA|nr:15618_t:CDS:10 [Gigaspora margarita]
MIPPFFTSYNDKNVDENDPSLFEQSFIFLDNKGNNNDMHIIAGYDWNRRMFTVHTSILKDRCDYFKIALSNQCIRKNSDGMIIFYKKDISPEIFKLILDYIYNGEVSTKLYDTDVNILDFIIAADEMLLPKLVSSLENLLIDKYFKQFSPEIETWVFCLITINKEQFLPLFEEHVNKICLKFFKDIIPTNINTKIEPRAYINALLDVHRMCINMFTVSRGDTSIISPDKALKEIVNRNHITGVSTTKSSELFSQFCDSLIKNYWVENEFERDLENFMTLFKYVEDKDIFLKFYANMLAKRLLNGTSRSKDVENSLISKLKEICGIGYTLKFQQMLNDMGLNKDLNDQFKDYFDFAYLVLDDFSWPILKSTTSFTIPKELEESFKNFETFYQSKYTGRKLNWQFHLSKGELKTNYCKSRKYGYYFVVSLYQMGILLQYNKNTSYTFEELEEKTGLDTYVLTNTLKTLITTKVLKLINGVEVGDPLSCYELDMDFKSQEVRIQLNIPIKSNQNEDVQIINARRTMLWFAVYNTMKIRKNMKFNDLVDEVIAKVSHRFKPKRPEIKKLIDELLEKEFIERMENCKDMFSYIPH